MLAGLPVLVSAAALAYGWRKDREFRHREYADRIRAAAGRAAVALERWQLIARQFSADLRPALVEAACMAADGCDRPAAAHLLRMAPLSRRAAVSLRIADERLEADDDRLIARAVEFLAAERALPPASAAPVPEAAHAPG